MKNTTLDNPEIQVQGERIIELDKIVTEVRESEEWESSMTILEIGMQQGEYKKLISQTCKKLEKGYTIEMIADILEEDESTIRTIVEIAMKHAPEYDTAKILKDLLENK